MKITKIHINEYQQFKDFELDLTYPEGHEFAGQPLKKVCFIGQSGTGKTTLLRLLLSSFGDSSPVPISFLDSYIYAIFYEKNLGTWKGGFYSINNKGNRNTGEFTIEDQSFREFYFEKYQNERKVDYIHFPAELIEKANKFFENQPIGNPLDYISTDEQVRQKIESEFVKLKEKKVFDFETDNPMDIWKIVLADTRSYIISSLSKSREFAKGMLKNGANVEFLTNEYKNWHETHPNPFTDLAKLLNPVISEFGLQIKTDFDFEKAEDLNFIQTESISGKNIPFHGWSTGTKQLIFSALPLFKLDTKHTVVFFDEPERSLFPDVQRNLIKYYTDLAADAQFFFATHSPLIASQFEPCERVILQFDDDGYVRAKRGIAPEGDDPNDLLFKDFGMRTVLSDKGEAMWNRFLELSRAIESETDRDKKVELMNEFLELGTLYNFGIYERGKKK